MESSNNNNGIHHYSKEEKNADTTSSSAAELTAAAALAGLGGTSSNASNASSHHEKEEAHPLVIPQRYTMSGRQRAVPFPLKLMKVLSDKKYTHIISWMPSGKSFMIHKPKLFATQVLPLEFKQAKHSSFTRKLHRWGFMRHYRGDEAGAFFHEDFQEGRLDMAENMSCYTGPGGKDQPAAAAAPSGPKPSKPPAAVLVKSSAVRKPVAPTVSEKKPPRRRNARATAPRVVEPNIIMEQDNIRLTSVPAAPTSSAIADIEAAMARNLRQLDNRTLLALQLQEEQPRSSEGGWADLKVLIDIEISRRILQEKIEQANQARRLAILQRDAQLQAEQQQQQQEQQERRDAAQLQALIQLHQFQQQRASSAPTFLPSTWQQAQPNASNSNISLTMDNRTLLALAAQNLALVAGGGGGAGVDYNYSSGGGLNTSIIPSTKPSENLISYATKRSSLPCTNIEGAKTA